ncbi:MAG: amino acid permease, partial [Oligoflexia bacterium]|nr:amino acid permease [Oligoflexia bacterium]
MGEAFSSLFRKKPLHLLERDDAHNGEGLKRELSVIDLTALGIAAIIGAGIFSTIGNASFYGGPAVVFLFIFTAIACGFCVLCYAEFASRIPQAGSAYTYTYATLGELLAWIIGWNLIMEYAIGNIAVAISWSDYFTGFLSGYGITWPSYLGMDYLTASRAASKVQDLLTTGGATLASLAANSEYNSLMNSYNAWMSAPSIGGLRIICDLPALIITFLVTALVYIGIKESKRFSNTMVLIKIGIVIMVILLGVFYVQPENWSPFAPNGLNGVWKGVSGVFFAYIGFDSISTTAEECKNPRRDLPRGMIASLPICPVLSILVALVLTGMTSYKNLQVGDPLLYVFGPEVANLPWIAGIIAVGAIVAMTTVLLVFQIGQPRIWMAMGRDGLLPPIFAKISPRFKTPSFSTVLTGIVVAVPSLFMNLTEVTDLTSIGTLFAFVLVCAGVLFLPPQKDKSKFSVPYINGKYLVPLILLTVAILSFIYNREGVENFFVLEGFSHKIPYLAFNLLA